MPTKTALPHPTLPYPSRVWRHKVRQTLEAVRRKYNITGRFTDADFYRICRAERIYLMNTEVARPMSEIKGILGACVRDRDGNNYIYLRSFFSCRPKLCMFTAGHELGHFFLRHNETNMRADKWFVPNEQFEREADYFARLALKTEVENAAN